MLMGGLEFYGRAIAFNQNCTIVEPQVCEHYRATERDPHQGHHVNYIDLEGTYHSLPDHFSNVRWITYLPTKQYDSKLSIHSGDIGITQCKND